MGKGYELPNADELAFKQATQGKTKEELNDDRLIAYRASQAIDFECEAIAKEANEKIAGILKEKERYAKLFQAANDGIKAWESKESGDVKESANPIESQVPEDTK
jgi:hypothetical protein